MSTVICADSLRWLPENRNLGSIVTSLRLQDLERYSEWMKQAATECFRSASPGCPVIFVQSDRKKDGKQFSKAHLLMCVSETLDFQLVWHKIELRQEVGKINLYRPSYRHMLCFGTGQVGAGRATPDVLPVSKTSYPMAFGEHAADVAVEFCRRYSDRICDPFCGRGTVLRAAEKLGMQAIGVDIDPEACEFARH